MYKYVQVCAGVSEIMFTWTKLSFMPIPVTAESKRGYAATRLPELRVRVPPGGMDLCILWLLCVFM